MVLPRCMLRSGVTVTGAEQEAPGQVRGRAPSCTRRCRRWPRRPDPSGRGAGPCPSAPWFGRTGPLEEQGLRTRLPWSVLPVAEANFGGSAAHQLKGARALRAWDVAYARVRSRTA